MIGEPKIEIQTTILKDLTTIYENSEFKLNDFVKDKNPTNVESIFHLHKE
ncbi:MAG: hypothetical protein LBB45_02965 [Methanobrevibacter sp.]|nr:hypothetical protein [Candidatus Methanovirga basalitermitum]